MVLTRSLANMNVSHFTVWVAYILIETQLAMRRTLSRGAIGSMQLRVVDELLGVELMSDSPVGSTRFDDSHSVHRHVSVVDRPWIVSCTATNLTRRDFRTPWPYVMLAVLLAATLVISELVRRGVLDLLHARYMGRHVRHRRALAHSLRKYSATIVQSFPDPLMIVDRLGYLSGLNAKAVEYQLRCGHVGSQVHVSEAASCGILPPDLILPHRRRVSATSLGACDLAAGKHQSSKYDDSTACKSTLEVVVSESVASTNAAASCPIRQVIVLHDLTEQARALDEQLSAHQTTSADNRALSQFLAFLTNDFPTYFALIDRVVSVAAAAISSPLRNPMLDNDPLSRTQRTISLSMCMMTNTAQVVINQQVASPVPPRLPVCLLPSSPPPTPSPPNLNAWINPSSVVQSAISDVAPNLGLRNVQLHLQECGCWHLRGAVPTVLATAIPKLVRVATYATRPTAQSWIEPIVNRQQNKLTLHCRGAMWIPPESSVSRFLVCQAAKGARGRELLLSTSTGKEWCGGDSRPEYIGDLMHAAMLLTMVTVSTLIAPVGGTLLLSHVNEVHGGFDLVVPLGNDCQIRSGAQECWASDSSHSDSSV
ncbi:hypothetical protein BCR44DRAFT_1424180 [Catenaria anguillulae PL171]|uniref:PAS domain-containing protein n=1 Tax=Catenaria anguillulae PL171 TaxID=765915 RepID=A0A1Y2I680_9FUNG|nr:hypothetical protein BCR44DRAFT_1424180 [Catenaria anguillulae PL171]